MNSTRLAFGLMILLGSVPASADPVTKGRALWENNCQSCHVVTREKMDDKAAADGRKLLHREIKDRSDAVLERYLLNQKTHTVCVYKVIDLYDARFLIAFMRHFAKPEAKELVPIAQDNSQNANNPPRGSVTKDDRK